MSRMAYKRLFLLFYRLGRGRGGRVKDRYIAMAEKVVLQKNRRLTFQKQSRLTTTPLGHRRRNVDQTR